ncbi:MAG: radical SAM protein [Candidatus Aminicenantes bacterium]|nr:radical SAM protein [Candidatus Aminicenantes bacterium]
MEKKFTSSTTLSQFKIWDQVKGKHIPFSFDLEITARCNNNCRHCYINLPASDARALKSELSIAQISAIADQAVAMGSLWCLITGGEPLLRADFSEIYLLLRNKGLLVSVYTNACLITDKHIALFEKFPPREIEVTVYGITQETYERVTRRPGSYAAFRRGIDLLLRNNIKVRLKAMALRSNTSELPAIAAFCRQHTKDYFRFDPLLHLRFDGNVTQNAEIKTERLEAEEIAALEQADKERFTALENNCDKLIFPTQEHLDCRHLFHCGAGKDSFTVSPEGYFHLCSSLRHPECVADLKKTTLAEAWNNLVPRVRAMTSSDTEFLEKCRACPIVNLCLWCPAHAHLETGRLDGWSDYFCRVAKARAETLQKAKQKEIGPDKNK